MKIRADIIAHALEKKHRGDFFITECKSGPTTIAAQGALFIFDAIAVKKSWTRPCVTIYEIKVNRQDFLGDEKWAAYQQFCNRFSFVCPRGLIAPEEISTGCGLITYNPETGALFTAKKSVFMDNPLPTNVFYYILMNRLEVERHPFFSEQREYFELLVKDKDERKLLAHVVKSKLLKENRKIQTELSRLEYQAKSYQRVNDDLNKLRVILKKAGISAYPSFSENLETALKEKLSPSIKAQIMSIQSQLNRLVGEIYSGGEMGMFCQVEVK